MREDSSSSCGTNMYVCMCVNTHVGQCFSPLGIHGAMYMYIHIYIHVYMYMYKYMYRQ